MKFSNNITLAIVLLALMLISVALEYWEPGSPRSAVDTDLFVIENIDPVDRVLITRGNEVIDCKAFSGGFLINEQFPMDENLLTVLAAVFQRVRVLRPLTGSEQEEIREDIYQNGTQVRIYQGENLLLSFWAGGDRSKLNSYFVTEEGGVYLVHLPGYSSYVSGLFELPLSSWRSRTIFYNTWRSLMSYSYQDFSRPDHDFQINYKDPFFTVPGVQKLDSNKVISYIQDLVSLKATSVVDTTYQGIPWLELSTEDIDPGKSQRLTLYGDQTKNTILGKAGNHYFLFSNSSLQPLIRDKQYFVRE